MPGYRASALGSEPERGAGGARQRDDALAKLRKSRHINQGRGNLAAVQRARVVALGGAGNRLHEEAARELEARNGAREEGRG
jgi:hypothetical protein